MRFHEIQLSERLVPSRQVAVKAEPAYTPTSKYEKALPLYNPQMPPPLPPEMILAQSLGQLVQTDQQALAMDAQLAQQAGQKSQPQPQQPSQPPAPQDLAQGQPVAEANYGTFVKALDADKDFVPAVAASLAGHGVLGGLLYANSKNNTPPVATDNQVAPAIPKAPNATELPKAKGDQPEGLPNQRPTMKSIDDPRQSGPAYKQLYLNNKDTITDPNKIKVGQVIDLPNGTPYVVKAGDTLSGIAQRFKRMSESMMPSKNFAGSKQNPINGKGIKKGADKTPVKRGDLVGGAAESRINEDEEPGFIQSIASKITQSAIQAGLEDGMTKDVVMWAAKNAMQPAPTWITKYYPGIRDDATIGELVLAGTIDAAMMVPIVRGARLAYAGGRAALGAAEKGIGAATVAGAEKVATKGAGMAATSAINKEVGKGIAQGASEFAGNTMKGVGNVLNKIGGGGSSDSYSNPVQAGKAAIKKRLSKGDTLPIPMNGKVYSLPIVDIQGNSYIVDASSIAGMSAGSKTMAVPIG